MFFEYEDDTKKRNRYSGQFKAKVVFEAMNGGKSLREIADDYQIHPNQIKNWKSQLKKMAEELFEDKRGKHMNKTF
jgi:transposase-like protein